VAPPPPPPATTAVVTTLVPGCVVTVVDDVAIVCVHFPNDVGFNAPIIPPLDLAIGHLLLFKNSLT
jgi:hypothetical protein